MCVTCVSLNTSAPTRSVALRRRQALSAAASAAVTDFMYTRVPKNMFTRWSTSSSPGRSRSSVNTRLCASRVRAVTFQSIMRMSSPA